MLKFQAVRPPPKLKQSEGASVQPCSKRARYASPRGLLAAQSRWWREALLFQAEEDLGVCLLLHSLVASHLIAGDKWWMVGWGRRRGPTQ